MRVSSLLFIAFFCQVCYGKGGNIPENTHANLQDSQHNVAEGPETIEESNDQKVDTSLFHVEETEEDGVKVLKLKAKDGTSTNKLTLDNLTVWEDSQTPCSSAVIYMNGSVPDLAVIKTKGSSGRVEIFW